MSSMDRAIVGKAASTKASMVVHGVREECSNRDGEIRMPDSDGGYWEVKTKTSRKKNGMRGRLHPWGRLGNYRAYTRT